jgi:hypothetical protein
MENHDLKVFVGVQVMRDWTKENLKQNACPAITIAMNEYGNPVIQSNIPKDMVIKLLGKIHDELIKDINIETFFKNH